jgi:hypothetical protein
MRFSDLCYGYNAFWRDLVPTLDLPDVDHEAPSDKMLWGDGFEIETVVACRMAAAGVNITEVPSVELRRIFGQSNLRTFRDGTRVLRTILAERLRTSRRRAATGLPDALSRRVPRRSRVVTASRLTFGGRG